MAFLARDDPENLIVCPFDDTHMISHKRYQYHISDCRRNHPNSTLQQCPFNARHWVDASQFRHHVANCPDSHHIEKEQQYLKQGETQLGGYLKVPDYDNSPNLFSGEDWDAEATAPPFILGQTAPDDFNPHAGPDLPLAQSIPGLHTEYIQQKPREEYVRQTPEPQQVPRVPKQPPKVLQQNPSIPTRGIGRGMSRGSSGLSQQPSWTAAGRGRGRNSAALSAEADTHQTNSTDMDVTYGTRAPLSVNHSLNRAVEAQNSTSKANPGSPKMAGVSRTVNAGFAGIIGRGRGRGILSINTGTMLPARASPTVSMATDSPVSSDSQDQFENDVEREKLKEERKLRKRLKQIEVLQQKQANGQTLTEQEIEKVQKKSALLKQLQDLKLVTD